MIAVDASPHDVDAPRRDLAPDVTFSGEELVSVGALGRREERFARGLAAGFHGEFMVAAALLVPQIESPLRFVVERNGGRGYGRDDEGLQDAHLLDRLLALDIVNGIFGEDIVFDLRGLLVERFGANLRNQVRIPAIVNTRLGAS